MNRKEIKELAKSKIKGNKWDILWPMLVISFVTSIVSRILGVGQVNIDVTNMESIANVSMSTGQYAGSLVVSIISGFLSAGYIKYILDFVRNGKFEAKTIVETIKEKWLNILIVIALTTIIVGICTAFFVIPGIIMALAYAFATYLVIDTDIAGNDAMKKSREMMKGYKWNYFVFTLSFIGWALLVPFTLGLLLIWLVPYYVVAEAIYYDKLKNLRG